MIVLRPLGLVLLQKIKCDSWDTEELDTKNMNKTINFRSFKRVLWGLQFNYFLPHKTGLPIPKKLCPGGSESLKMVGIYTNTFLPGLPGVPRYLQLLEGGLYYLYINCWGLFQFGNFTLLRQNCILFLSWSLDPLRSKWNTWLLLLTNFNKFLIKLKL